MCKVSIIVPVYNCEAYLEPCLESLISQTIDDFEVVIVNDGSTDDSLKIAQGFASKHSFIKVYSTKNKGPGHARNYGARQSCGDYLAFVDGDDCADPDYCKAMYDKAVLDGNDLVICLHDEIILTEEGTSSTAVSSPLFDLCDFSIADRRTLLSEVNVAPWGKLIERGLFFKAQFPNDLRYAEDQVFSAKVFCLARCIGSVKRVLYHYYREVHNGITSSFGSERLDWLQAMEQLYTLMETKSAFSQYQSELEFFIIAKSIRLCSAAVARTDVPTSLRINLVKCISKFMDEKMPDWRGNSYYINDVRKRAHSFLMPHEDRFRNRHPHPVYCNYSKGHMLLLILISCICPHALFQDILVSDQLLFFLFRKVRWEVAST